MARKLLIGNIIEQVNGVPKVHDRSGREYRPNVRRTQLFQTPLGEWLDGDAWPGVNAVIVCRTVGCEAEGVEVQSRVGENVDGVYRAACGACGQSISEMWVDESYQPLPLDPPTKVGTGR